MYRNVKQYPRALEQPHVVVVRIDAPIYFANVETVRERLEKYVRRANGKPELGGVKFVVVDFSPVSFVDSTGRDRLVACIRSAVGRGSWCGGVRGLWAWDDFDSNPVLCMAVVTKRD